MKKNVVASFWLIALSLLFAGISAAESDHPIVSTLKHRDNGLSCADCHVTGAPNGIVVSSVCIRCHDSGDGTYRGKLNAHGEGETKKYTESGRTREMAIHDSHQGRVRCTYCHTVHKKPAEPMLCNRCHKIEVKVK